MYKIIGSDGKEYGPVSADELRQWMTQGRVNSSTQAQMVGDSGWRPLSTFPELNPTGAQPPMSSATPPYAGQRMSTPIVAPPTYLVQSILVTLLCCLPFDIPAIIFAAQVNSKFAARDYEGAAASSRKARMWCWVSFGDGAAVMLVYLLIFLVALAGSVRLPTSVD
jgi:hypothetical protein